MLNIFKNLLDANQKEINKISQVVQTINSLEKKYEKITDKQLREKSEHFKKFLSQGQTLDQILPEVYAATREAFKRTLKVRLYDVQLIAALALHQGKIAEQKTGEGKTFSAVSALYLNSLTGAGVHLVTVNDYLARRECGWTGPVYHALGVSVATIVHEEQFIFDPRHKDNAHTDKRLSHLKPITRKEAYQADITIGTNNEFGFDYLRDNGVYSLADQVQRGHYFAVVDEVDSVLVDEARTPLIISRPAQEPTSKYYEFAKLIDKLSADTDYVIDEKARSAHLTEHGITKLEKILGVDNLYEKDFSTLHHLEQALKARTIFFKDRDYVVKDDEVIIVDDFTGRLMPGRRYSEGLHQAIEAKEEVKIQQESQTLATISFQNYFRMYQKLAGMTGTAATEAEEFHKIYKLDVLVIPTHKPMIRVDYPDVIYKTQAVKYTAVAKEIEKVHTLGQPILVGTTSIQKNEFLSSLLKKSGISHALLNAKNHEKEAEIIAEAGQKGAVTVATNMAGRGVDIKLGPGVDKLGGLYVIGTERHESRRIDNQLRGRSGRQGDPGTSKFFVSLEDDLMRIFGGEQVAKVMNFLKIPEDTPIEHSMVSKALESAQVKVEGHNFDIRKTTVEYDDVMNQQRQIIYGLRKSILEAADSKGEKSLKEEVMKKIDAEVENIILINSQEGLNVTKIIEEYSTIINFDSNSIEQLKQKVSSSTSTDEVIKFLQELAHSLYQEREERFTAEVIRQMEIFVYLTTLDTLWIEHLDTMDDLRAGIGLRSYAQRDPLIEYKKEGFELFDRLIKNIDSEVVHRIFKVDTQTRAEPVIDLSQVTLAHQEALDETQLLEDVGQLISPVDNLQTKEHNAVPDLSYSGTRVTVQRGGQVISQQLFSDNHQLQSQKVGRNDLCPCGSGLKYKRCGLINSPIHTELMSKKNS